MLGERVPTKRRSKNGEGRTSRGLRLREQKRVRPPAFARASRKNGEDSWRGRVPGAGAGELAPPADTVPGRFLTQGPAVTTRDGRPPGYEGPASQGV